MPGSAEGRLAAARLRACMVIAEQDMPDGRDKTDVLRRLGLCDRCTGRAVRAQRAGHGHRHVPPLWQGVQVQRVALRVLPSRRAATLLPVQTAAPPRTRRPAVPGEGAAMRARPMTLPKFTHWSPRGICRCS